MKKLTLSIGLIAAILSSNAQDTTCTYFTGKKVAKIDYYADTVISVIENNEKYYEINITYGDVLCLDLYDKKKRIRKVIAEYFDGKTVTIILDSKQTTYFSELGVVKVLVGKPKLAIKL
tara:strand:+ start:1220 stop:1576 length:357 start_codon:yes stop_codon:yes gene_type:complete